jgi:hypothetical protein
MEGATAVERVGGGGGVDWAVGWVEALARVMAVVMMAVVETVAERAVKVLAEGERAVVAVMTAMAAAVKA